MHQKPPLRPPQRHGGNIVESITSAMATAQLSPKSLWINDDVRPAETARRTWTIRSFHDFWLLINCNIVTFMTGSALIPLGLSWWQATICIVAGNFLSLAIIVLNSVPGARYHIGFPIISRAIWGMWGSQFPIWNRIFLSVVWYASQSWTGGQCFYLIILALDPNVDKHIPNNLPHRPDLTTARFVSYFIFCVISLPLIWIRPHKLQGLLKSITLVILLFFLALLIWALATMGPDGLGSVTAKEASNSATGPSSTAWQMMFGIVATIGSIASGILSQNDYTRLARSARDAKWGQIISYPIYSIGTSMMGILVVAATQKRLGYDYWYLPSLLAQALSKNPTAAGRAGVFFAGLALTFAQLGCNVFGNALAGGIDLAAVLPRYVNIRRGAYITAIISPVVNPWRMVDTANIFITVMSSYGVFLAPMTGMMVGGYYVVHRQKLDVDALFQGDSSSMYWYSKGVNWRAVIAWLTGMAPCLPGFIAAVNNDVSVPDSMQEFYMINYLYGFLSSAVVLIVLHAAFPERCIDAFVKNEVPASQVQDYFSRRWDVDAVEMRRITATSVDKA